MAYIGQFMDNYFKDDEVRLYDSLLTDFFGDVQEYDSVPDGSQGSWFDGIPFLSSFNDGLVSDCMMMSDSLGASLNPLVQSEHSYSITAGNTSCAEIRQEPDIELESEAMNPINPNLALNASDTDVGDATLIKTEDVEYEFLPSDDEASAEMQSVDLLSCEDIGMPVATIETRTSPTFVVTCTTKLVRHQPTIIVTNAHQSVQFNNAVLENRLTAKPESGCTASVLRGTVKDRSKEDNGPVYILTSNCQRGCDDTQLPLTPPASSTSSSSSSSSDSECSHSPKRMAPNSPQTVHRLYQQQSVNSLLTVQQKQSSSVSGTVPSSGVLILTEEEKRTLIAEGYPVPTRLPLTKQEEKNLKKVQRKIKNKMSAQESRRKKKDYVESLEKKLEASNQENNQLKKQLETLVTDNKSLLSQLHKLQSLANSLSPLQSSTCLAVFILFFAVGFGVWCPRRSASAVLPTSLRFMETEDVTLNASPPSDYFTPNIRSRTLKSYEDDIDASDSISGAVYSHSFLDWLLGFCRPYRPTSADGPAVKVSSLLADRSHAVSDEPTDAVNVSSMANITTILEFQTDNSTWTESNAQLNVTYAADMISVLV